ncbi:hypothetical protein EI42_04183 [Thermosporothrix hazakensis]|jgi:hypothetical protein|uniref:Uncharacterized protein n=2 Tax=Thermosporothrix TaxID=768650 RepID=A0A326U3I4_THEHA|nr:hypothetical protein [Thermosporothrix hazakensis]PZW25690.1 hypothetical protein EI42_04183 [Thermosporothrix hazakensis]BBH89986.1 hypothetical protein KTC_47370 [Thermosporothrix sp. COM3]GCE48185.1 hypothetical protein KTH_30540 [Thermosporothrix hazakensis]
MRNIRLAAALFVFLLIGTLSLAAILTLHWLGPALAHGTDAHHVQGTILFLTGNERDFHFQTSEGQILQFQCRQHCKASYGHMQRHIQEKAPTDVYYIIGPGKTLIALDVD